MRKKGVVFSSRLSSPRRLTNHECVFFSSLVVLQQRTMVTESDIYRGGDVRIGQTDVDARLKGKCTQKL
jgi:hypothetical protein